MTLDFPAINRALAAAFGPGVVECQPSDEADYVLQFSRGETEADRRKAADIVGRRQPKRWYFSRVRRVERRTR
jgi:hypothetical protein